jgi:hypothetical protein
MKILRRQRASKQVPEDREKKWKEESQFLLNSLSHHKLGYTEKVSVQLFPCTHDDVPKVGTVTNVGDLDCNNKFEHRNLGTGKIEIKEQCMTNGYITLKGDVTLPSNTCKVDNVMCTVLGNYVYNCSVGMSRVEFQCMFGDVGTPPILPGLTRTNRNFVNLNLLAGNRPLYDAELVYKDLTPDKFYY